MFVVTPGIHSEIMNFRLSTQAFRLSIQSPWILNLTLPPTARPSGRHWILGMKRFKASACSLVSTSNTGPDFVVYFSTNLHSLHLPTGKAFSYRYHSPALERNPFFFLIVSLLFFSPAERKYSVRTVSDPVLLGHKLKYILFFLLLYATPELIIITLKRNNPWILTSSESLPFSKLT